MVVVHKERSFVLINHLERVNGILAVGLFFNLFSHVPLEENACCIVFLGGGYLAEIVDHTGDFLLVCKSIFKHLQRASIPRCSELSDGRKLYAAKLALDKLVEKSQGALAANENQEISQDLSETIDCILYLAGFAGSLSEDDSYIAFAHQFYNSVRGVADSQQRLHGEIVAFGLLVQMILNEEMIFNVKRLINYLGQIDNLFTLAELGLEKPADQVFVAERIVREYEASTILPQKHLPSAILEAMKVADHYVELSRERDGS